VRRTHVPLDRLFDRLGEGATFLIITRLAPGQIIAKHMPKWKAPKNHRRGGRPATTGPTPMIGLRLARDWVARVDSYATKRQMNRSGAIRRLLEKALASEANEAS
jgi:hypothetical protein